MKKELNMNAVRKLKDEKLFAYYCPPTSILLESTRLCSMKRKKRRTEMNEPDYNVERYLPEARTLVELSGLTPGKWSKLVESVSWALEDIHHQAYDNEWCSDSFDNLITVIKQIHERNEENDIL